MSSGADLFVVCKQCGSEVSPYITECPYCGSRLRRRAPKLPRAGTSSRTKTRRLALPSLLRRSRTGLSRRSVRVARFADTRPYATIALVVASCAAWVVFHARPSLYLHVAIVGPIEGDWWKLFTTEFAYLYGLYAFLVIATIAIFGWLLERRHGPVNTLAVFFGGGATGALAASAVYSVPVVGGGNGAALALLAAWAAPDLRAARAHSYYEGDLLGAGVIAALLIAVPFAMSSSEASWLAGVVGGALGLLVGLGLSRVEEQERY